MQITSKRLFLLDMDGTIYLGNRLFDYTLKFLERIEKSGARYIFFTNNSSKGREAYLEKIHRMGIKAESSQLITSTHASIKYLQENHADELIYTFGTASFRHELITSGLNITTCVEPGIKALIMGYDPEITAQKLEDACILLGRDIDYIATNPDYVCPTEYGYFPDCGSVAIMLKNATGREPRFMGKPAPDMVMMALEQEGVRKEDTVLIGDRQYTDVACGIAAGIDTVLVLSGETARKDIPHSPHQPTWIADHVGELRF